MNLIKHCHFKIERQQRQLLVQTTYVISYKATLPQVSLPETTTQFLASLVPYTGKSHEYHNLE